MKIHHPNVNAAMKILVEVPGMELTLKWLAIRRHLLQHLT